MVKKNWHIPIIYTDPIKILSNPDNSTSRSQPYFIWLMFYTLLPKLKQRNNAQVQGWFSPFSITLLSSSSNEIYKDLLNLIDKDVYQQIYEAADNRYLAVTRQLINKRRQSGDATINNDYPVFPIKHSNQLGGHPQLLTKKESNQIVSYFTIKDNRLPGHYIYKVNYIVESTPHELIHHTQNLSPFQNYQENDKEYILIDIWTNGELSPRKALLNAFKKLFELFFNLIKYNLLKPIEI